MKPKGRPQKRRIIRKQPDILKFSPRGKPGRPDETELTIDEFEALRLSDSLCQRQVEAAKSMGVSQQTFSRVIRRARRKLADAVVSGRIVRIQGGACEIIPAKIVPHK